MHLPDEAFIDLEDPDGEARPHITLADIRWDLIRWSRHLPMDSTLDSETHARLLSFFFRYVEPLLDRHIDWS